IVMGTTGWNDQMDEVKKIVEENGIGFIYGSNFSIGVNVFFKMIENAAKIMDKVDDYDVYGHEFHHNQKLDSPSGTAKSMANILLDNMSRKNTLVTDVVNRKIEPNELHFSSTRVGNIPGTHSIGFDSTADTIELKHTARNRSGFALGAVMAAEWIQNKKGFFSVEDMMNDVLK
ncbi:4-hydroxy-tetrahydrodipicolinate reductase, partial [Nanoarchaeota archaeon]